MIFFELDEKLANNTTLLPNLIPSNPIIGYWGGMILRCKINTEMAGLIDITPLKENQSKEKEKNVPLAMDIEKFNIYQESAGHYLVEAPAPGFSVMLANPTHGHHINKMYGPVIFKNRNRISLSWSYAAFARFCSSLLLRLEGRPSAEIGNYTFGQIFDRACSQSEMDVVKQKV